MIRPSRPFPLGAHFDGRGTNFSLFTQVAERVELCMFDDTGRETRLELRDRTGPWWHGYLAGIGPGTKYGYRVHGPWVPRQGHRCNAAKLLLDPYALAVEGEVSWHPAVYPYSIASANQELAELTDSAPFVPRCVVVDPSFEWGDDRRPDTPWDEAVLYEVHVRGFTKLHPALPQQLRGTYAGLASPPLIDYLKQLGITAVELMPVHQFIHDHRLIERGLRNYWGYNSIGYFAPHNGYAAGSESGQQVREFKSMVKTLHEHGIEVILDVVYNHTAEGNHLGPMLCYKGIDNASYYRLEPDNLQRYRDYTGTGNSLNMRHPSVLQMVMDSLRYWVEEMHVDGFRFDLAAALARGLHEVDRLSAFFDLIQQDPVLNTVKLIAEPWDLGDGGYQVGNFPPLWSEWNGRYRDCIRDCWRNRQRHLSEFGYRLTGSSDLYERSSRSPYASINFVTSHDGFTLADLVSFDRKHNEANGEQNQDGTDDNRSWNCGAEGTTEDIEVLALRARQRRNFLATLLLSQGVPMLLAGDELGRSQGGNNNAYCQDNELSWLDWGLRGTQTDLEAFTRRLIEIRRGHPVFRRRDWFQGSQIQGSDFKDVGWFKPDGSEMSTADWQEAFATCLAVFLNGDSLESMAPSGESSATDSFLMLINTEDRQRRFALPPSLPRTGWVLVIDTSQAAAPATASLIGPKVEVRARSLVLLQFPGNRSHRELAADEIRLTLSNGPALTMSAGRQT